MGTLTLKTLERPIFDIDSDIPFDEQSFPTKEEIAAIEDHALLWEMQDDYECAIIRTETALRFPGDADDRDWFFRARSALTGYRISLSRVERQAKKIFKQRPGPSVECVAPDA